jgi:ATP phosphoribosyltransferase-like protein
MQGIIGSPPEEDAGRLVLTLAATAGEWLRGGNSVLLELDESERLVAYETSNRDIADGIIAPGDRVAAITDILPSLKNPTVAHLHNSDWVSIETILPEREVRRIVPELIKLGAEGIVEYPLNKII